MGGLMLADMRLLLSRRGLELPDAAAVDLYASTDGNAELVMLAVDTLRRMKAGPTSTEQTLRDYLHWVIDQHYYLDPRGTMQTAWQVQVRRAVQSHHRKSNDGG